MSEKNIRPNDELEREDQWDFDAAEARTGAKSRAVVSVAFSREDFERVSECAEARNMRTSEFIREAALEKATHSSSASTLTYSSSWGPQRVETRLSTGGGFTRDLVSFGDQSRSSQQVRSGR
jgi:hypothetical protein